MKIYTFLYYVLLLPGAFFAPVIHETVKALCSTRLGDPTPKKKGFLSGNPLRYFEPVGFFCILLFGYGWGQPVPTSPLYYKDRRRGVLITYITPSVVNLLVGLIAAVSVGLLNKGLSPLMYAASTPDWAANAVYYLLQSLLLFARCNIGLAIFNILPVCPLDGAKILPLFFKPDWAFRFNQYEKLLQVALLLLMGFGLIGQLIDPLIDLLMRVSWIV